MKKMKVIRKFIIFFVLLLLLSLPAQALSGMDPRRELSLAVSCLYSGESVSGMTFYLYKAADISPDGGFVPASSFAPFVSEINASAQKEWRDRAYTLYAVVLREGFKPDASGVTDKNGCLSFAYGQKKPDAGLYLITAKKLKTEKYIYSSEPFLISLPGRDGRDGPLVYDVVAAPKLEREENGERLVSKKVIKIWKDKIEGEPLPAQVEVMLYRDGRLYDRVFLNKTNGWVHTWENLSAEYSWELSETPVNGYEAAYSHDGSVCIIENRIKTDKPDKTDPDDNPYNHTTEPDKQDIPTTSQRDRHDKPTKKNTDKPDIPLTGTTMYLVPLLSCAGLLFIILGLAVCRRKNTKK